MNFVTHNDDTTLDANRTCLQGYIDTSFDVLVQRFGRPLPGDGHKTDAEWLIKTDEGTTITIYNWKNGKAYNGRSGSDIRFITRWHVGGHAKHALLVLRELLTSPITLAA